MIQSALVKISMECSDRTEGTNSLCLGELGKASWWRRHLIWIMIDEYVSRMKKKEAHSRTRELPLPHISVSINSFKIKHIV